VRFLAVGGLSGPVVFVITTVTCGLRQPDYSHLQNLISELATTVAPLADLINYGGFLLGGLLLAAFGVSLGLHISGGRALRIGSVLITLFGIGVALSGVFSCDVGCPQSSGSLENLIHNRIAPLAFASGSIGCILLGVRFRSFPSFHSLWAYSIVSGVLGLCFLVVLASSLQSRQLSGLWQRLLLASLFSWCAVVGYKLLRLRQPARSAS